MSVVESRTRTDSRAADLETIGDVKAKRILVPVERTSAMEFTLRVARMVACESGGIVRLLAAVEIGLEAECFHADLVAVPLERRRSPAAWITNRARA
jgi:hypothetical protein